MHRLVRAFVHGATALAMLAVAGLVAR